MTTEYLYESFLTDKRIYQLNRRYWKRFFSRLIERNYESYRDSFSNGRLFYDGNPMASAYVPDFGKSVRIIQEEIETDQLEIGVWVEEVAFEDQKINELVISLELSKNAAIIAKQLITGWFKENWTKEEVDAALKQAIIGDKE